MNIRHTHFIRYAARILPILLVVLLLAGCSGLPLQPTDPSQNLDPSANPSVNPTVGSSQPTDPDPTDPSPTDPSPTDSNPTNPAPTDPDPIPVAAITIAPPGKDVYIGDIVQLSTSVLPENADNKAVTWKIVNGGECATISQNGVLTANAPGQVVIRAEATDGSGVYGELMMDILQIPAVHVQSITLSAQKTTLDIGESVAVQAAVLPANADNTRVIWSIVSGGELAQISAEGIVTANASGAVTVRATAEDGSGVYGEITLTVNKPPVILVSGITISGAKDVLVGETLQLSASVMPENAANQSILWSIHSGSSYADITADGLLTGKAEGTVKVRATAQDGSGVYGEVTVKITTIKVSSITITADRNTIYTDETLQLNVSIQPENAANKAVTWSVVSGGKYGSVDSSGKITALQAGTLVVKATANDGSGKSATFTVTIKEKPLFEGSGTADDPFLIRNLQDLMNLRKVVDKSGYHFLQVADIDCSSVENWIVIGDFDLPFRHHYDGGGYTISNLCLDGEAQALFCVVEGSHFKNVNIVNAHTKDNHQTRENNTGKYAGTGGRTAALVGYGTGCSFKNCTATVNFQSSNTTTGGLIGFVVLKNEKYTLMEDCHVSGTITSNGYTGGLIARIWNYMADDEYSPSDTITVRNCSADVEIIVFTGSSESCIGGLIGESFGVRIEKCHAKGSINVIDGDIGGLVGNAGNYTDVVRCYAEVDIYASSDDHYGGVSAGGLIGHIYSRSDVYDCYATGDITAPYVEWSPCQDDSPKNGGPWRRYYNPCGSLIGTLEVFRAYSEDQKITVYNCYATGTVDVPNICEDKRVYCHGALIGLVLDRYTYSNVIDKTKKDQSSWDGFSENYIGHFGNNYNLEDLRTYYTPLNDYEGSNPSGMQNPKYSAMPTHDYVEIITEAQLLDESIFVGWDFQNIWIMTEDGPQLR